MSCPNCNRTFRAGGNGLAFHLTWCKPAQPALPEPQPLGVIYVPTAAAMSDGGIGSYGTNNLPARAPRGRKLTRKERRARLHELLTRPVKAHKAPAAPKGPKMPASTGKHARCVAHVPMTRTAPGVAYACFDVTPDADAIAERAAFLDVLDGAWNARHVAYLARLTPEPTDVARALVGCLGPDYSAVRLERDAADREKHAREVVSAHGIEAGLRFPWLVRTDYGQQLVAESAPIAA